MPAAAKMLNALPSPSVSVTTTKRASPPNRSARSRPRCFRDRPWIAWPPALFFLRDDAVPGAGRMQVSGGGYSYDATTGGLYDFVPDKWGVAAPFPSAPDAPNAQATRTTVWTGTEMIAWDVAAGVGARYTP
jgi:hypothetical protein